MKPKKETTYQKAVGYYYYENVPIELNGAVSIVKVKKYRHGILSSQKRILKGRGI